MNDVSTAQQSTPTPNPPTCGRLALQLEIDDLWQQTRSPKIGLFAMRRIYGRLAELRAQLNTMEIQNDD